MEESADEIWKQDFMTAVMQIWQLWIMFTLNRYLPEIGRGTATDGRLPKTGTGNGLSVISFTVCV